MRRKKDVLSPGSKRGIGQFGKEKVCFCAWNLGRDENEQVLNAGSECLKCILYSLMDSLIQQKFCKQSCVGYQDLGYQDVEGAWELPVSPPASRLVCGEGRK